MTTPTPPGDSPGAARFRRNLVRVMAVQIVSILILWLLQRHFTV